MLKCLTHKGLHKCSAAHALCRMPGKSFSVLHWCCLFYLRNITLIPPMCTKGRGGEMCGGERGGPPVCHLNRRQTTLSLLRLSAKQRGPQKGIPTDHLETSKGKGKCKPKPKRILNILTDIWIVVWNLWHYFFKPSRASLRGLASSSNQWENLSYGSKAVWYSFPKRNWRKRSL